MVVLRTKPAMSSNTAICRKQKVAALTQCWAYVGFESIRINLLLAPRTEPSDCVKWEKMCFQQCVQSEVVIVPYEEGKMCLLTSAKKLRQVCTLRSFV